jgi:hypothetical protein
MKNNCRKLFPLLVLAVFCIFLPVSADAKTSVFGTKIFFNERMVKVLGEDVSEDIASEDIVSDDVVSDDIVSEDVVSDDVPEEEEEPPSELDVLNSAAGCNAGGPAIWLAILFLCWLVGFCSYIRKGLWKGEPNL